MAEPASSWCIASEKKFPDIALEVILNEGGIPKLDLYQRFGVPEVWIWQNGSLAIHRLGADGSAYHPVKTSGLLPGLDFDVLHRCTAINDWLTVRRTMRAALGT